MLTIETIPVAKLREHPANRKRFDETALAELADSIREKGVLNPLLLRKKGKGYEVLAGARRLRAAKAVGLAEIPAIVRDVDDREALELLVIDNLQREGVHPLEEAEGYRILHEKHGYSVEDLAAKVGKSRGYVYARIKLCELTDEAKQAFFDEQITAGHAILLARLKPADQKRALDPKNEAVFTTQWLLTVPHGADVGDDGKADEGERFKPRSVRELQDWIDKHVRLDVAELEPAQLEMEFPDLRTNMEIAEDHDEKIVPITYEHHLRPSARAPKRTYTCRSWKRADGKGRSKSCDHGALGVVVAGPRRGGSFRVCVAKKKCTTHWGKEIRAAAKRAKERAAAGGGKAKTTPAKSKPNKWEIERQKEEALVKRWNKAAPALQKAVGAAIKKAPVPVLGDVLTEWMLSVIFCPPAEQTKVEKEVSRGKTALSFLRHATWMAMRQEMLDAYYLSRGEANKVLKLLGVDAEAILDKEAPEPKPAPKKKTAKKRATKKKAKRKGRAPR